MNFHEAKKFIIDKLENELPDNLYYHGFDHTLDVIRAVDEYATIEKIKDEDLIILKTAALYHDSGFLISYRNHEDASVKVVYDVLPTFGYSDKQIERICNLILSTKISHKPKNILEKILCDADLDYLGRDDFFMVGIKLFYEWNEHGIITSLKEWYYQELYFLQQHEYYTKPAIKRRESKKMLFLAQIKELIGNTV